MSREEERRLEEQEDEDRRRAWYRARTYDELRDLHGGRVDLRSCPFHLDGFYRIKEEQDEEGHPE